MTTDDQSDMCLLSTLFLHFNMLREWRNEHCAGEGPDIKQATILELISLYDGITATGLSKFLNQNQSSIKETLDPMVECGWVTRGETSGGRNIPLYLSDVGIQRLKSLRCHYGGVVTSNLLNLRLEDLHVIRTATEILLRGTDKQFKELWSS
jgi:DNA-binding MarR family transcriptional regulator